MSKKVAQIQAKENVLNSAAFSQALTVFQQTGTYPNIGITSDSIGAQALKFALSQIGKPYVWGAAGPNSFDCSGLVMWAYARVGISLAHFTGDQWLKASTSRAASLSRATWCSSSRTSATSGCISATG